MATSWQRTSPEAAPTCTPGRRWWCTTVTRYHLRREQRAGCRAFTALGPAAEGGLLIDHRHYQPGSLYRAVEEACAIQLSGCNTANVDEVV